MYVKNDEEHEIHAENQLKVNVKIPKWVISKNECQNTEFFMPKLRFYIS